MAADDPRVPIMCYRLIDSFVTCMQVVRLHAGSDSIHGKEIQTSIDNLVESRRHLPEQAQKDPVGLNMECTGKNRADALNTEMNMIIYLQQQGDRNGAAKCQVAMDNIR